MNLFSIDWSPIVKIALLVMAGIILLLVLILLVYEIFFKKNFVYNVTYYTTEDPEFANRTYEPVKDEKFGSNISIVPVATNEEGFTISKIILTKTVKHEDMTAAAKLNTYNIKDIVYKSSQAKIVGEYETKESDMKFTSIIVTKKK